ncbi:MAG: transposase [Gammaproteobacteria bacterium]|nr:transposase [Gammaproteobacteria bacterium]MBT3860293.1 transposase [Gammaproteobacteria bacterium]MBT3987585.1 transposase [Gammaproteobacteria bacterium]MBT4255923.1 transposase [Gammaproteobacteria bacterium]MBT4581677.1 transposase [Gammaproteobacteria bacterium]
MTRARYQQVSLDDTPYYHCISRCVRRAYLCGDDPVSGQNFDHRKQWLVTRIKQLSSQFSIDICAYAVMSNHYHLVLFVNKKKAESWSDEEVIQHWTELFPRNASLIKTLRMNMKSRAAQKQLASTVSLWRERLMDISWFMRCLNESIARRANKEDECSGRFWEGRFKSQALLDEKAVVTCMAYVDLNPVRAGISESLEASDFTSVQERLINHAKKVKNRSYRQHRLLTRKNTKHLVGRQTVRKQAKLRPMAELATMSDDALPVSQQSYFDLLENTCKALHSNEQDKRRNLEALEMKQKILQDLGISADSWMKSITAFQKHYSIAAGSEDSLLHFHESRIKSGVDFKHPHKWIRGIASSKLLYGT